MAALGSFTAFESDALSVAVGAVSVAVDVEVLLAPPPDEEDDEDPSILEMRWESMCGRQLPPTCCGQSHLSPTLYGQLLSTILILSIEGSRLRCVENFRIVRSRKVEN